MHYTCLKAKQLVSEKLYVNVVNAVYTGHCIIISHGKPRSKCVPTNRGNNLRS